MKLVIGAEMDASASEFFRVARKLVQDKINFSLEAKDFGVGLPKFHFIAILRDAESPLKYPEIYKYYPKKKKCDYRIKIDIKEFLSNDQTTRCSMICDGIEKAISHLADQKTEQIDMKCLRQSFRDVRKLQGW